MTMSHTDPVLRMALRQMLSNGGVQDVGMSAAEIEERLGMPVWTDTLRQALRAVAVRWATQQSPRHACVLRKALGEVLTEQEQAIIEDAPRRARIQQAIYNRPPA
jgi:hypothetical protein